MAFLKYFLRVKKLDDLIRRKATGSPAMLAKKMNLSRSVLMDYLHDMKKLGFPIKYDRHRSTYYYEENVGKADVLITTMIERVSSC